MDPCSICLEPLGVVRYGDVRLDCGHVLHTACLTRWGKGCPTCRASVSKDSLAGIYIAHDKAIDKCNAKRIALHARLSAQQEQRRVKRARAEELRVIQDDIAHAQIEMRLAEERRLINRHAVLAAKKRELDHRHFRRIAQSSHDNKGYAKSMISMLREEKRRLGAAAKQAQGP